MDEHMLQPLLASLDHYEGLNMLDDVATEIEEEAVNAKVSGRTSSRLG